MTGSAAEVSLGLVKNLFDFGRRFSGSPGSPFVDRQGQGSNGLEISCEAFLSGRGELCGSGIEAIECGEGRFQLGGIRHGLLVGDEVECSRPSTELIHFGREDGNLDLGGLLWGTCNNRGK
jgi:hypothetical protein